jgi:SAM-dependent methyltransferase
MLGELDLEAELHTASLFALPFEPGTFDAVVCLSVLEHLTELDEAMAALRAQLKPGGVAILGFPVRNPVTDLFFRAAGYKPREVHPSSHADIIGAARRHPGFTVDKVARMPWFLPLPFAAYVACRCVAR